MNERSQEKRVVAFGSLKIIVGIVVLLAAHLLLTSQRALLAQSGVEAPTPHYLRPGVTEAAIDLTEKAPGYVAGATPVPAAAQTPAATPTPDPAGSQLRNGDFELGGNGDWRESSSHNYDLILERDNLAGVPPDSGSWAAWLGGADDESSLLAQDVALSGGAPTLRFSYEIRSTGVCDHDSAFVIVEGTAQQQAVGGAAVQADLTVLATYDLCAATATDGWAAAAFDLSGFSGQTVTVSFHVETDGSVPSSLFLDDVRISATGAATPSPTPGVTLSPTPSATPHPDPGLNQLYNGDFELGANGDWRVTSATGAGLIFASGQLARWQPYAGSWAAWLGGADDETAVLAQDVILSGSAATLSFYYQIDSEDACSYDYARVVVSHPPAARSVLAEYDLCTAWTTGGWTAASFDVSAFLSQTVQISFEVETDASVVSDFLLDDVRIDVTGNATPSPTPTATATDTPTDTPTATPVATNTPTATATPGATASPAPNATLTDTPTPTLTPSATLTATVAPTPTDAPPSTATLMPSVTATATESPTPTPTSTATSTATDTPPSTPAPTLTSSATATATELPTETPAATAIATATSTSIVKPTATDTPAPSVTPAATATPLVKPTLTPAATATPTVASAPTATGTLPPTNTPTATPASVDTPTPTTPSAS